MKRQEKSFENFRTVCGIPFPVDQPDLLCHLSLFRDAPRMQEKPDELFFQGQQVFYTGMGRFEHAKIISTILHPKSFEWHPWTEKIQRKACESPLLAICGCGASSKSTSIGEYAFKWWMAAPTESAVIMASKTIESAKKRIWREVAKFYSSFSQRVGGYKDAVIGSSPRPYVCPIIGVDRKKDEAHGLFVTALHGKELEKEIAYIKGFHPRRILVIADEWDVLEEGGQALFDTFIDNLRTGAVEAQYIGLGNDPSLLNALGDAMQPEFGKPVTMEQIEWKSIKGFDCLRLDAFDSPNIKDNDKWTGLVRQRDIDDLVKRKGENSPSVWIQLHGIHPPEGSANTVVTEAALLRFHAFESVTWKSTFTQSAALDPAFGGDACIFRKFKRGHDTQGNMKIEVGEPINIPIVANDPTTPADYQIAHKVISLCRDSHIAPDEFAIASTGIGRGVAAILKREWSPRILEVQEGGAPSDRILSQEHPVPANEEFDRKVTELWFDVRYFVEADMIRGLDQQTAIQLCSRTYEDKGVGGRRKLSIQKKEEMLHSPDCFIAGSLVATPRGEKAIEELKIGDTVLTPFGESPIVKLHKNKSKDLTTIRMQNGKKLCGKRGHKILTNTGWKRLDELSIDNEIESVSDRMKWAILNQLFTTVENTTFKHLVGIIATGIKRRRRDFFIESSGLSNKALFLKICVCITKMVIGRIIQSATWNLSLNPIIAECTRYKRWLILQLENAASMVLLKPVKPPNNGMVPRKEKNGILRMEKTFGKTDPKSNLNARYVTSILSITRNGKGGFAQIHAICGQPGSRYQKPNVFVLFAGLISLLKNILLPKRVRVLVATNSRGEEQDVYNLTLLRDNAYYVNGILAENCADCLATGIELFIQKGIVPVVHTDVKTKMKDTVEKDLESYDFDASEAAYSDPLLDAMEFI